MDLVEFIAEFVRMKSKMRRGKGRRGKGKGCGN